MIIKEVNVYGLSESITASRFPKDTGYLADNFRDEVLKTNKLLFESQLDTLTAAKLAKAEPGSGHDCFLSGVLVQFNIQYKQYWSRQVQRYHFIDFVSSQSTMHKIQDLGGNLPKLGQNMIEQYKKGEIDIDMLMNFIPMGMELWARMSTNYLQLKTIYRQRRNHKSKEWQYFCNWIETLPESGLITG